MPKYELMYIVASSIADDEIPTVTDGILKLITGLGGTVTSEEKLGKKKLAYPIAKTRNGFYAVVRFEMPGAKLSELNQKVQNSDGIIRHLTINIDEDLIKIEKDAIAQEKMNKNRAEHAKAAEAAGKIPGGSAGTAPVTEENLDAKIEEALSEDLKNV